MKRRARAIETQNGTKRKKKEKRDPAADGVIPTEP